MDKFSKYLNNHGAIFALSLVIGVIVIAPNFYFRYWSGHFEGVDMFRGDAELNYVAQIQEVNDGHYKLGNIYLKDGKDVPSAIQQPLPANVIGAVGKVLSMSAADVNLFTKFLFPFLLTFIVYYLLLQLTDKKKYALLGAAFIMLMPATLAVLQITNLWETVINGNFVYSEYQFLSYSRSINPQFSSLFFYGYFLVLWIFLYGAGHKKVYGVLAGVVLGLSFYTYFFVFSFISMFTALLFIYYVLKKDYQRAKYLIYLSIGGIIIGLPSAINFIKSTANPLYAGATARVGAYAGHKFVFSKMLWGGILLLALFYKKIRYKKLKIFAAVYLLTGLFLANQHIISGQTIPAPQHYHWYYLSPVIGAGVVYFGYNITELFAKRYIKMFTVALLILFVWVGVVFQVRSYQHYEGPVTQEQRYAKALEWLNKNTLKDESVYANDDISHLVVSFTHNNSYYHRGLTDFMISDKRMRHSLFTNMYLDGVNEENAREVFTNKRDLVGSWLYGELWRQKNGCNGCFPEVIFEEIITDYQEFLKKDFVEQLNQYPLNYLIWDKQNDPNWALDKYFDEVVFAENEVVVYRATK